MIDLGIHPTMPYAAFRLNLIFKTPGDPQQVRGTGFFVRREGKAPTFVTCRHLVDPAWRGYREWICASAEIAGYNVDQNGAITDSVRFKLTNWAPRFPVAADLDLACLPVNPAKLIEGPAKIDSVIKVEDLARISEFDSEIRIGDFLASLGYFDHAKVQLDSPVLLAGVLASDPRSPATIPHFAKESGHRWESRGVLYQSLSRAGMSGAPLSQLNEG